MTRIARRGKQVPIETLFEVPLSPLSKLSTHKKELFPGMTPHITKKGSQVCKTLPEIARHLFNQGAFDMHNRFMGQRESEVLRLPVHHRQLKIVLLLTHFISTHHYVL